MNSTAYVTSAVIPEDCVTTHFFPTVPWDNQDSLVPKQVDNIVNFILIGLCLPVLFIISFVTNIINMVVFYKHGLTERINACLFTLSLLDLVSISVVYGHTADIAYMFLVGKGGEIGPLMQFYLKHFLAGLYGFVTSSQLVYSFIALERCLCVTRPLLVKTFLSTKTTMIAMWTMVVVVTTSLIFVVGVRYNILCVYDQRDGSTRFVNYPRDFYFRNKHIMDAMYSGLLGLFIPGLSLISVSVCTIITAVKLKELTQWREKATANTGVTSKDLATARVIIGTSVLFIICIIPATLMRTIFLTVPGLHVGGRYENLAWVIQRFFQLSSAVNNTFNFFVYYTYGSKFRETTRRLFSCCCRDGQKSLM